MISLISGITGVKSSEFAVFDRSVLPDAIFAMRGLWASVYECDGIESNRDEKPLSSRGEE